MAKITAEPCGMGQDTKRNSPENAEMALAFALHDHSQKLLRFSYPQLRATSPDAFSEWLRTIKGCITFYEERNK